MAQSNGGIIGVANTTSQNGATGVWTSRDMELAQLANKWPQTAYQYQIARSLRFNSADSAYLGRDPASASNRKTWTWSGWVKRSTISAGQILFNAANGSDVAYLYFNPGDALVFGGALASGSFNTFTTTLYRDPSAWYHIVCVFDTTQAVATDRTQLYVNGQRLTLNNTPGFAQNSDGPVNSTVLHYLGTWSYGGSFFNGYMADVRFIDGQALTPTSFGEYNADTGVWQPKTYAGTYGTNGFWLKFADNSNTTAATLGADSSGNGSNWTPNNFSVTAGAGNDSLIDSPTSYGTDTGAGGEVRGNYATTNPLRIGPNLTLSNGNLDITATATGNKTVSSTIGMTSGKWYWEATLNASGEILIGVEDGISSLTNWVGSNTNSWSYDNANGQIYYNNVGSAYGATLTTGDVLGIAVDADARKIWFSKNGTWQNSGSPTGGTNAAFTTLPALTFPAFSPYASGSGCSINFGQRPFAYTAPSGFKALCTQNLPTPAVGATAGNLAGNHMNTVVFTGNATIPRSITGFGFQPDILWNIRRDIGYGIQIFDAVRGAGLRLNTGYSGLSTAAEGSYALVNSFDADGFTINAVDQASNNTGGSYAVWGWNTGTTNVSNTNGTITSTVRANPTAGMSVVGYTGTGSNATVGHGLGAAPSMIITKKRSATGNWQTYHSVLGATKAMFLDLADTPYTNSLYWNNTEPTSSVFSIGGNVDVNTSGATHIAYCFAEVDGFSKFGRYIGNNSTDGTFVYCGFRPRWVMVKDAGNSSWPWWIVDIVRNTVNPLSYYLTTNTSNVETNNFAGYVIMDAVSNGFKIRSSDAYGNTSGETYIFAAFAEFPFKYSLAR